MSCPFRAVGTTASGGNKLRVPLVEWRIFQNQQGNLYQDKPIGGETRSVPPLWAMNGGVSGRTSREVAF